MSFRKVRSDWDAKSKCELLSDAELYVLQSNLNNDFDQQQDLLATNPPTVESATDDTTQVDESQPLKSNVTNSFNVVFLRRCFDHHRTAQNDC